MIRIFEYSNIRHTLKEYYFDTNEYTNIFVSKKLTLMNIRIYSYQKNDTNEYQNKYSDKRYSNIQIYSPHSAVHHSSSAQGLVWYKYNTCTIQILSSLKWILQWGYIIEVQYLVHRSIANVQYHLQCITYSMCSVNQSALVERSGGMKLTGYLVTPSLPLPLHLLSST